MKGTYFDLHNYLSIVTFKTRARDYKAIVLYRIHLMKPYVGPTLYKCYTNVFMFAGLQINLYQSMKAI